MERMQATLVREYAQGLAWVMAYYYDGCASWNWYYPFHYAPFASGE
jgi:5'-3' exoribonuclease 2